MAVTMICPNLSCRATIVAPDSARGKVLRCAHCQQTFVVPREGAEPPLLNSQGNSMNRRFKRKR